MVIPSQGHLSALDGSDEQHESCDVSHTAYPFFEEKRKRVADERREGDR